MIRVMQSRLLAGLAVTMLSAGLYAFPERPTFPEVQLSGSATVILDGSTSPDEMAGTDFGVVDADSFPRFNTFKVHNLGENDLLLSPTITLSGPDSSQFFVSSGLGQTSVPPGGETSFELCYYPGFSGSHDAQVELLTNDSDETTYTFAISGAFASAPLPRQADIESKWIGYSKYTARRIPLTHAKVYGAIGVQNIGDRYMRGCRLNVYVSNVPYIDASSQQVYSKIYPLPIIHAIPGRTTGFRILPFSAIVPINHKYVIGEIIPDSVSGDSDFSNNRVIHEFVQPNIPF